MFGKYFAQTFTGSMAGVGVVKHAVWGYCIANARFDGTIEINAVNLAAALGDCTEKQVEDALTFLCSPDPKSRTPTKEGRKLEQISAFEYRITNYEVFRAIKSEEDRREYNRLKKQESRERQAIRRQGELLEGALVGQAMVREDEKRNQSRPAPEAGENNVNGSHANS